MSANFRNPAQLYESCIASYNAELVPERSGQAPIYRERLTKIVLRSLFVVLCWSSKTKNREPRTKNFLLFFDILKLNSPEVL